MAGSRHERISAGPPFSVLPQRSGLRWLAQWLVYVAIAMSWDGADTLRARLENARGAVGAMFHLRQALGKTYQGFVKQLVRLHDCLLEIVTFHLRHVIQEIAGTFWTREGLLAFAIDGSRVECPRTKRNEAAFGRAGRKGCGPQMWLTTLWHMGTGLPWAWLQGRSDACERQHLRQMLPLLPEGALVVGDAGFVGYELLRDILATGRSVLVRVGGNVSLLRELGWFKRYGEDTVFLWPEKFHRQDPMVLRLIELQRGDKKIYLITDLPSETLSPRQAATLYTLRWGVEVFYRSLKQTLKHRRMRSDAPQQAWAELAWSVVGLQLMGLMSVREMLAQGVDPREWSVAATRNLIRQALDGRPSRRLGQRGWKSRLAACRVDSYVRAGSKKSRDWPDRKHDRPPGPPKIRDASATEVRRAQQLRAKLNPV